MDFAHRPRPFPFGRVALFALVLGTAAGPVRPARADERAKQADVPGKKAAAEKTPSDEAVALRAAARLYDGIRAEVLPNGLKVYLKPVPGAALVTTMVAYKVGSADEHLDQTGLSHYLEHLMFKGTEKLMPGDIDKATYRAGGANNAYTSEDYTVFHFDFAPDRWVTGLKIEADRMRNLRIDAAHEFQQEKGAVISELERNEDEPWDLENKAVLPLLFETGPYGHPVIGERQHVRAATAEVIKAHYDRWYHPNNASLVVCGDFDPDAALATIKELFGPIPRATLPERRPVPEPARRKAPVAKTIESKFEVPRIVMGFNGVTIGSDDDYRLDVIQAILSGGKTGRLYRHFVEGEAVASSADSTNSAGRYPGWFALQVQLLPGKDRKKVEAMLLDELKNLGDEPVSAEELARAKRQIITALIFSQESVHALADIIARGVTSNDLGHVKEYLPRILAVTAADVQAAARKHFDPASRVVVWSVPPAGKKPEPAGAGPRPRREVARTGQSPAHRRLERGQRGKAVAGQPFTLKTAKRVELPNGAVLLLMENRRLPVVVAEVLVKHARLLEPEAESGVAALTGALLDEGTDAHSGPEIARLIEDVGGVLSLDSSGGRVKVLTPNTDLGLSLLFECLVRSNFPAEPFDREKAKQLAEIEEAESLPEVKAQRLFAQMCYGEHNPLGRSGLGTAATVGKLTPARCKAHHARMFVPNNAIIALVGDFDAGDMENQIARLTAGWKKAPLDVPPLPPIKKPGGFTQKIVTMPAAAQLHFYMGEVGIRRDNPDYYKLLVMDYVLGTGPGFTDRLSSRLRDRQGLAYTVTGTITASAGEFPGLFTCYIGTPPQNFEKVKAIFLEELHRLRTTPPTAREVEDAKTYLIGNLPLHFGTSDQIATELLAVERYGLGFAYLESFRAAVATVTQADVQAVAEKYLDPAHMVLVAVGAIDQAGKPVPEK